MDTFTDGSSTKVVPFAGLASGLDELAGADAQADLAAAIVRSTVQLNEDGLKEALYIIEACGSEGYTLVSNLLKMKNHQAPGAMGKLVEALKAISLFEYLRGFNLNLGGK